MNILVCKNPNIKNIKINTDTSYINITPLDYLTYDRYKYNNYNFLPLEYILNNSKYIDKIGITSILPSNSTTLFKYAQTSYYGYAEKYNISVFNKLFNNQLLNYEYYNDVLGLTMTDVNNSLKQFIKQTNKIFIIITFEKQKKETNLSISYHYIISYYY